MELHRVASSADLEDDESDLRAWRQRLYTLRPPTAFNPAPAAQRVERFWALPAEFGLECSRLDVMLSRIVSDRYALVNGFQIIRDELQFAAHRRDHLDADLHSPVQACGADFSIPSVLTTLAHTNCGDRVLSSSNSIYMRVVGIRFASMSELGETKMEVCHDEIATSLLTVPSHLHPQGEVRTADQPLHM